MAEIPFRIGETANLKLATAFDSKVTVHFDAKLYEKIEDASGGPKRDYKETVSWDENLVPEPAPKGETGSIVKWKAANRPPGVAADDKPAEVKATVYGKNKAGEAVSTTPADDLLVVPGMVDVRARVEPIAQAAGIDISLDPSTHLVDFGEPIVRGKDVDPGWERWNGPIVKTVDLKGEMRWIGAGTTPQLFGVWVPKGVAEAASDSVDFVVFFHPAIRGDLGFPAGEKDYPFHARYVQCVRDYCIARGAKQTALAKKQVVYVFPQGSTGKQLGDFTRHDVLLRTLEELCVHLGRFGGFKNNPRRTVGRVALACYSFGANHLDAVLRSCRVGSSTSFKGTFFENHWRETYCCDPVPHDGAKPDFAKLLAGWWKGGADTRCLRFYIQPNAWDYWNPLAAALELEKPTTQVFAAREMHVPNDPAAGKGGATVLETQTTFWQHMFFRNGKPILDVQYFDIHGWFPNLFQYHGLKNSLFKSL